MKRTAFLTISESEGVGTKNEGEMKGNHSLVIRILSEELHEK
jgi:hypothetical protein